jgi:hydrogenase maturation protein HypF
LIDHDLPLDTSIICITADGYGYGRDGSAWGGEVLFGNARSFENLGGLDTLVYPGGDLTAKYAARPLVGILNRFLQDDEILEITKDMPIGQENVISRETLRSVLGAINERINSVVSSSAGRFLDAATALLQLCHTNSYDGECPMKLEALATKNHDVSIKSELVNKDGRLVLDTAKSFESLLTLQRSGYPTGDLAYAIQWHLGDSLAQIAIDIAEREHVRYVGFSGGVALNRVITDAIATRMTSSDLIPLLHREVPPGDGGISIGQIGIGIAHLQDI